MALIDKVNAAISKLSELHSILYKLQNVTEGEVITLADGTTSTQTFTPESKQVFKDKLTTCWNELDAIRATLNV